jgi:hypothetical protein
MADSTQYLQSGEKVKAQWVDMYEGESVNRSQMDIKRKTYGIRTG